MCKPHVLLGSVGHLGVCTKLPLQHSCCYSQEAGLGVEERIQAYPCPVLEGQLKTLSEQ